MTKSDFQSQFFFYHLNLSEFVIELILEHIFLIVSNWMPNTLILDFYFIYLYFTLESIFVQFLFNFCSIFGLWSDFYMEYTFWNILTFKEDNGDIFARGTQDMKSVGIQHIEAIYRLKVLQKKKFKRTIHMWWVKDTIYLFSECT